MNKAVPILLLILLPFEAAGAGIEVMNATAIWNTTAVSVSQNLSNTLSNTGDRTIAEYADAVFNSDLMDDSKLSNNASSVNERVIAGYSDAIFNPDLMDNSILSSDASTVRERVIAGYSDAAFNPDLYVSTNELNKNASLVAPGVSVQYADSILSAELGIRGFAFVDIRDNFFANSTITIPVNTQVTWINFGNATHTVTADDGSFNSGNLVKNQSFTYNFTKAGTFTYHCSIHPSMKGTVIVTSSTPGITVISPNGGENLVAGTKVMIKWSSNGNPGATVKIELLKGGVLNRTINSSIPTSRGSYNWTIPSNQTPGTNYRVRITSITNPAYSDSSNANFTISALPTITVVSPNGGENWQTSTKQVIKWTYTGSPGSNVKIELLKGGILNRTINSSVPTSSGSYNWTILSNQTPGTNYRVRITSITNPAYNDSSNANFTINNLTTHITVVSPNGGEKWQAGTKQAIKWTYSGSPGSSVKIELMKAGVLNRTINSSTSISSGSYNWTIPSNQTPGADYRVRIKSITNPAYNDSSNANFNISAPLPACNTSTILGYSFNDTNGNKTKDAGESGLSNWTINLKGFDTCTGTLVTKTMKTNTTGYFAFKSINPGYYEVSQDFVINWVPTTDVAYTVKVPGTSISIRKDFGNIKYVN